MGVLQDEHWATWLSVFPNGADVFTLFGSEMFLPTAAVIKLLLGLEATGHPFLAGDEPRTLTEEEWGRELLICRVVGELGEMYSGVPMMQLGGVSSLATLSSASA